MIFQSTRKSDECKCTYRAGATCSTSIRLIKIPKLTSVVTLVKGPKQLLGFMVTSGKIAGKTPELHCELCVRAPQHCNGSLLYRREGVATHGHITVQKGKYSEEVGQLGELISRQVT